MRAFRPFSLSQILTQVIILIVFKIDVREYFINVPIIGKGSKKSIIENSI